MHNVRNIVHHDIKPENILVDKSDVAKITDFGVSVKIEENGSDEIFNSEWGTKQYLPPECWKSNEAFIQETRKCTGRPSMSGRLGALSIK